MVYVDSGGEEVLIGFNSSRLVGGGEESVGFLFSHAIPPKGQQTSMFRSLTLK